MRQPDRTRWEELNLNGGYSPCHRTPTEFAEAVFKKLRDASGAHTVSELNLKSDHG